MLAFLQNPTPTQREAGIGLLRISLGVMFLAHGLLLKVLTFGMAGTAGFFVSLGLPAWTAYATAGGEIIGADPGEEDDGTFAWLSENFCAARC